MTSILIADDDKSIRDAVGFYMRKEGYDVVSAKDGDEALRAYEGSKVDLAILDIMMPSHGGYEVCSAIRDKDPVTPIIFLSAKGDLIDKNLGFKLGADDYITKPFDPGELVLRVNSCLRRANANAGRSSGAPDDDKTPIVLGDVQVDTRIREVSVRGRRIDLTAKEYEVLAFLARRPDTVLTRQQVLDAVWGSDYFGSAGVVAVFIRKLREKIEECPSKPVHILTEWGIGYRIV